MPNRVELKGGGTLHIDMLPDATVGDLKDRLSESTLIMPKLQRLFHEVCFSKVFLTDRKINFH